MQVSVIIVNYNTRDLLYNCLRSLFEQTKDITFEVIVVDNASSDDSVTMVRNNYPSVKLLVLESNVGFGNANNKALKMAKGDYVFLLNSDTIILNNILMYFLVYYDQNKSQRIGALGTYLLNDKGLLNTSSGYFPSIRNELKYVASHFFTRKDKTTHGEKSKLVDYIIGADLFMNKKVLDEIGYFDPRFFMYYEETDLQKRMVDKGLCRVLIPGPLIIHLDGGSFEQRGLSFHRLCLSQKSLNYYLDKHYSNTLSLFYTLLNVITKLKIWFFSNWTLKEKVIFFTLIIKRIK